MFSEYKTIVQTDVFVGVPCLSDTFIVNCTYMHRHKAFVIFISGSSHKLNWLPRELPEGMRVIVSTLEGECLKALRDHAVKAKEIYVNPLNEKIRESIAQQIFLPYNKRLDDKQVH